MDPITKLVSGRLRTPPPRAHPEPDLLNAFAESALPEAERQQVLQHLGTCSDCREILYLAMPESADAQKVLSVKPTHSSRLALRWGTLVASVAVLAGVLIAKHSFSPARYRPNQVAGAPSPSTYDNLGNLGKLADKKAPAELDAMRQSQLPQKAAPGATSGPRPELKHMTAKPQAAMDFEDSGQVRMSPPSRSDATAAPLTMGRNTTSQTEISSYAGEPASAPQPTAQAAKSEKAKDAGAPVNSATAFALQDENQFDLKETRGLNTTQYKATLARAMPAWQWNLSPEGALQRSSDAGQTWLTVPVASGASFRALSALGSSVWVGGAGGTLYHSADSGQNWTRIAPVADGQNLRSDVTHIDFSDALNGVVTAKDQLWTTADGGVTWQRK